MNYHYPKSVVVIADNLSNFQTACHLFANQFKHAHLISAHNRISMIHRALVSDPKQTTAVKAPELIELMKTHKFIMDALGDPNYHVRDIELAQMQADSQHKPDQFHVILVLEGLFSQEQIKRIRARKIYFYENRGDLKGAPNPEHYCQKPGDHFEPLGYSGSMVNLTGAVQSMYKRFGFEV